MTIQIPIETSLEATNKDLFRLYERIREWCSARWKDYNDVFEQVRHDDSHSDAMLVLAGTILKERIEQGFLIDKELFLLAASIRLHDIGMQYGWKEFLGIAGNRGSLTTDEREKIRYCHAETTGKVIRSFRNSLPGFLDEKLNGCEKGIICRDLNEELAFIAESHNKRDIAGYLKYELERRFRQSPLRIALITALVQFCDALHMDSGRLNEATFHDDLAKWEEGRLLEAAYSNKDWQRYFQCYHVKRIIITPLADFHNTFRIEITTVFHPDEREEVRSRFIEVYRKRLTHRDQDCLEVLKEWFRFDLADPFRNIEFESAKRLLPERFQEFFYDTCKPTACLPTVLASTVCSPQSRHILHVQESNNNLNRLIEFVPITEGFCDFRQDAEDIFASFRPSWSELKNGQVYRPLLVDNVLLTQLSHLMI
jgi:hypothetical protein